ncbi:hypothetical protein [Aureivirga sp. CE67]|uniref:hypothetical protein n=1 Tax=Aureivirga sp. CE67 TaxID=1788983 RepID=UPI0018CBA353|nr:hypothetical protein [Aureivirga sp. CE67]
MAKVKCEIELPTSIIDEVGNFYFNNSLQENKSIFDGKIIIQNDNINTSGALTIFGIIHSPEGIIIKMNVFVNNNKINNEPILANYQGIGNYKLEYTAP